MNATIQFLEFIYEKISEITAWLWGLPLLILLIAGGLSLTIILGGIQFKKLGFIFKHTLGEALNKDKKEYNGEISPLQGMIAALSATVGTGNIVGVGAAIAVGGPGALFWIWVSGFLAMAIKFSEVTMSCKFRKKIGDGYKGGPYMYIRDGLNSKFFATFFSIMMLICMTVICGLHSSSITSNLKVLGVPSYASAIVMIVFLALIIWGGMKSLVKITDKMVPIMSFLYVAIALIVIIKNIGNAGEVFASIFKGAFSGTAAAGGFAGATLMHTVRFGLARGVFSNDAGLGLSASVQAQVENIGHPAKQGMWAIVETFIDTIVLCTLSGLVVLFTGVWQTGGDGSTYAVTAFGNQIGHIGTILGILCLFLFGLSSLITDAQGAKIQAVNMFNSPKIGTAFQMAIIVLVIFGSMTDISKTFMFVDFSNAIILLINVSSLLLLHKVLRKTTKEWFDSDGDLSKIKNELN